MRRLLHGLPRAVVTLVLIVAFTTMPLAHGTLESAFATPGASTPSNAAIDAKREQAASARQKLSQLSADLEMRYEELAQVEEALQQTRSEIASTQAELEDANVRLGDARTRLGARINAIYRNGTGSILDVLLGATDFKDLAARLTLLRRISSSDASLVASVKDAKDSVEKAHAALQAREQELAALRDQAEARQAEFEAAYDAQKQFVAGIDSELKTLIEQERVRQEQLAAARAAAAAAAAAAAKAAAKSTATNTSTRTFDASKLGSAHSDVVAIAKSYLGVPYVWGGSSPSGFDCSGFTMYCYGQLGIKLPRTSRSQFTAGAFIPPDRLDLLQPGDLVFFGTNGDASRIHHVGIFVGNGSYIHAPETGDVVRISSLTGRIASSGDYVGGCRP